MQNHVRTSIYTWRQANLLQAPARRKTHATHRLCLGSNQVLVEDITYD